MISDIKKEIRCLILNQEPFCLTDIYNRINSDQKYDNGLILVVIDELFEEGLLSYKKLYAEDQANFGYAYVVNKPKVKTKKITNTR